MSVTIVTGIWNIKRDTLTEGWSRSFNHYLDHLDKLLKYTRYFKPNNYKDQYYIMKNTYYGDASQNLSM